MKLYEKNIRIPVRVIILCLLLQILQPAAHAQSLAVNTDGSTANASALLDVKTTVKGVLIPRMSRAERNAIAAPATGLLIFQNAPDSTGFYYYNGSGWTWLFANANADSLAWRTGGNTGTTTANFIGTKDNIPFNIRVNNQKSGMIDNGTANTFFGYQSANANTSGQNNAAFGHQALLSNTTGTNNTAVGGLAARDNTTGSQNTAAGYASMVLNTVGQNNTAYGFYSMYNNVAGSNATAIGYQSMLYANNTTTPFINNNVAVGFEALKGSATPAGNTGLYNSAIGYQALLNNSSGNANTGLGYLTLSSNTSGNSNTATGQQALNANVTGSANTALGTQAGYLATGSNNVFLGYQAGYNETGNNKLYIANNSTNPPLIYGDFSNKTLGIGTITPNSSYGFAKVEIASENFGAPTDLLIRNAANSSGYAPGLVFQHARGTLAAPIGVTSGDYLGAISTMNYDGSGYLLSAGVDIFADGTVATGIIPTRLQFNTMNTSGSYANRLTIKNDGKVGIATASPNSTLHVDGTVAVGLTMGVTGGPSGSPASLANAKYYIGLSPADGTNNYYQLPSPVSVPGRQYIIRNNSSADAAILTTAAGLFFPGNSSVGGSSYTLNAGSSVKTVMVISDGVNWTILKQD
ncbi:MAG: hypothetical protein U0X40_08255 [Ferruginibacter sp.]